MDEIQTGLKPIEVAKSENVPSSSELRQDAKSRMFPEFKAPTTDQVSPKKEESVDLGKGEEVASVANDLKVDSQKVEVKPEVSKGKVSKEQQEIGRITRKNHRLQEEKQKLEAEIERIKAKYENPPTLENFNGDERAFDRALIKHEIEIETDVKNIEKQKSELGTLHQSEWEENVRSQVKDIETFQKQYESYYDHVNTQEPELKFFASKSKVGPRILEEAFSDLFKNEATFDAWSGLTSDSKKAILAQMELDLIRKGNAPAQEKVQQKSNAPKMIAPEKEGGYVSGSAKTHAELKLLAKKRMFG